MFLKPLSTHLRLTTAIALLAVSSVGCTKTETVSTNAQQAATTTQSTATGSTDKANQQQIQTALTDNLKASGIDAHIIAVTPTAMPDLFWVKAEGMPAFFTDKTGRFIVQGDVVQVGQGKPTDISQSLRESEAKASLAAVAKKDMIIFSPQGKTKAAVYVFTDSDCGYCRKLHSEINDILAKGIEIRYLAWPRSPQTEPVMQAIWCSKDKQTAMTQAKSGKAINAPVCKAPIQEQLQLGMNLGVRGTPAIFTEEGKQIGGYVPANIMAQQLGIN